MNQDAILAFDVMVNSPELLSEAEKEDCFYLIKSECKSSFFFFAKYVLNLDKLTLKNHKVWCDEIQERWTDTNRFMRLKPRGTYKTTVYGIALMLWVWATKSQEIRIFYTSSNGLLLAEVSDSMTKYLHEDSLYSQLFGITKDKESRNTNDIFNITGRGEGKGFSLVLRTAGGSTAGVHPNLIIVDDPADKADRESKAIRRAKEVWYNSLIPLLVSHPLCYHIMYIATMWHMADLTNFLIQLNEKLRPEKKWDINIEGVFDVNGQPNFPDISEIGTLEAIGDLKASMEDTFFACQYLNKVMADGMSKFPKERLHYFASVDIKQGKNYCFFDPSKGKVNSDYPACIWVNWFKNKARLFDAIDKKIVLADLIKIIAERNKTYYTVEMVYEDNGTMLLGDGLVKAHKDVGHPIYINGKHESQNKESRINEMQPQLFSGFIQFDEDYENVYPELFNQLTFFPAWGNDDYPDVIQKAVAHLTPLGRSGKDLFISGDSREFEI